MTLVCGSKWYSQTFSSSMVRVTDWPAWRIRNSSSWNSRGCRSISLPSRRTLAADQVHLQVADPQQRLHRAGLAAAGQRLDPGDQLGEGVGLDQIVVAAGAAGPSTRSLDLAQRRQEQHRRLVALAAQRLDHGDAVHASASCGRRPARRSRRRGRPSRPISPSAASSRLVAGLAQAARHGRRRPRRRPRRSGAACAPPSRASQVLAVDLDRHEAQRAPVAADAEQDRRCGRPSCAARRRRGRRRAAAATVTVAGADDHVAGLQALVAGVRGALDAAPRAPPLTASRDAELAAGAASSAARASCPARAGAAAGGRVGAPRRALIVRRRAAVRRQLLLGRPSAGTDVDRAFACRRAEHVEVEDVAGRATWRPRGSARWRLSPASPLTRDHHVAGLQAGLLRPGRRAMRSATSAPLRPSRGSRRSGGRRRSRSWRRCSRG